MLTLDDSSAIPAQAQGAFLAVGNFDGVHRGHARLIAVLRALADRAEAPALALTFDPHPLSLLRPEQVPPPLVWTERKVELLQSAGASDVVVFQTGHWLLDMSAREFFDRVVVGRFRAKGMVEGSNFGFGRDRGGDSALLASWCREAGLTFEIAPPTAYDGQIVSSSRIRSALRAGEVADAAKWLGRPHRLRGDVVAGAGRGADLGFPTANLEGIDTQIPDNGVYAARAGLDDGRTFPAAVHIGPNATFGESKRTVEVHLIDFNENLYGRRIQIDLLRRLRETRPFEGVEPLLKQMRLDVDQAREIASAGDRAFET